MAVDEQRLLARIEANANKLVTEMKKASDVTRQRMAEIDASVANSNKKVTDGLGKAATVYRQATTTNRAFGSAVQNSAYQIGDFAVQVAAGTSATRALAQQLPQMLGGLGVVGAVAGAAAAIAIPLAANFFSAAEEIKKIDAMSLDQVRSRVAELRDLSKEYNDVVFASGAIQTAATEEKLRALDAEYQAKLQLFRLDAITLTQRKAQLESEIAAQRAAVEEMRQQALLFQDPDQGQQPYVRTRAQAEQLELVQRLVDENQKVFLEIQRQEAELDLVNLSLDGVQSLLSGASSLAADLANNLGAAAENSGKITIPGFVPNNVRGGRGADPRSFESDPYWEGRFFPPAQNAPVRAARAGRGGGGGGGAAQDPRAFLQERLDAAQRAAEAAKIEANSILLGAEAAATAKAKLDLLAVAKQRNIDLDKVSTQTGMTLREEIDAQAATIGRLTVEAERYTERARFMGQMNDDMRSGFVDMIVEGANLSDVLRSLAKDLARAALNAALFNTGPFAGAGGGFSLSSLLPSFDGGGSTGNGPRSGGLDGKGGFPAMLHPREVVIDRARGQAAGGTVGVRVYVDRGGNWQAEVAKISGQVSAQVVGAATQQQRRNFGATLQNHRARGTSS